MSHHSCCAARNSATMAVARSLLVATMVGVEGLINPRVVDFIGYLSRFSLAKIGFGKKGRRMGMM